MTRAVPWRVPSAGRLFHVVPVSVQLLLETEKALSVADVAVGRLPKSRNRAELTLAPTPDKGNLRYVIRLFPVVLVVFTARVVAEPKFVSALEPSRTYRSACGDSVLVVLPDTVTDAVPE